MLSIVIPAHNEEREIGRCLAALTRQTVLRQAQHDMEVIVVDNASTDRTAEITRNFSGKLNLRVIHEERKGRGAARRAGFAVARGDIVLSTDADTAVPPHWAETMTEALRTSDAPAVTGPCRVADLSPLENILFNIIQPLSMHCHRLFLGHYWLTGSNFAIRKTAYDNAGGFNPAALSSEDADLAERVRKLGKIRYVACPVTTSGRRFRGRLIRGLWEYPWTWFAQCILRRPADLKDVR